MCRRTAWAEARKQLSRVGDLRLVRDADRPAAGVLTAWLTGRRLHHVEPQKWPQRWA